MKQLTEKDTTYQEKVESKDQRKARHELEEKVKVWEGEIKKLSSDFVNEKIIGLDIPIYLIEEMLPLAIKQLITIYKSRSDVFVEHLRAKDAYESTPINKLYDEEVPVENSPESI